jgi:hypothetical protein
MPIIRRNQVKGKGPPTRASKSLDPSFKFFVAIFVELKFVIELAKKNIFSSTLPYLCRIVSSEDVQVIILHETSRRILSGL